MVARLKSRSPGDHRPGTRVERRSSWIRGKAAFSFLWNPWTRGKSEPLPRLFLGSTIDKGNVVRPAKSVPTPVLFRDEIGQSPTPASDHRRRKHGAGFRLR